MNDIDILVIGLTVILFACVSDVARNGRFTAPMMFAGIGLLLGPMILNVVRIPMQDETVKRVAELTLVVALFTDSVRINVKRLRRFHSLPIRLLGIGLPLTMVLGTFAAWWIFPSFGLWEAAVLAVMLGPTDAALGEPVVTSEEVPALVRQGLNVESGMNDGLGLPCLFIVASLAGAGTTAGAGDWTAYILLQILGGPVIGATIATVAAWAIARPLRRGWVGEDFFRLALFALPVVAYLAADMLQANGFLAAFAAGVVVSTRSEYTRDAVEEFAGTIGQLLNSTIFFLVGALLLPQFLHHIGWQHVVFALLALTVLRMGPVAMAVIGMGLHRRTTLFLGWYGPRGMASVIYLLIVLDTFDIAAIDDIAATVALTVLASIVLHGLTAAPGSRRYGQFARKLRSSDAENAPVPVQRVPGELCAKERA
ncbi:NhaP-type antiporter [Oceaniovalibus guishaninsula JLT2003]|uniref:NhaP-type antiporter n=1 Tax=Oceaniovalibus guishaninsula JLT2003 TaxID=1231392 RepID=K2HED7_9RHOB|nr:sodium:proton antiporter [Oceaniovalibus guishaninsula]EKE44897.1 NhaP-type antiporter [Oceaniovalibus guishaninsula JLT2003]